MHTHQRSSDPVTTIGLDIGKNTFHLVGLDKRGAIAMRIKVSRSQLVRRLANLAACAPLSSTRSAGFLSNAASPCGKVQGPCARCSLKS
jgi:hypothetical protein